SLGRIWQCGAAHRGLVWRWRGLDYPGAVAVYFPQWRHHGYFDGDGDGTHAHAIWVGDRDHGLWAISTRSSSGAIDGPWWKHRGGHVYWNVCVHRDSRGWRPAGNARLCSGLNATAEPKTNA